GPATRRSWPRRTGSGGSPGSCSGGTPIVSMPPTGTAARRSSSTSTTEPRAKTSSHAAPIPGMKAERRLRIGIDTGGTFTDVVAVDESTGAIAVTKTPTTPQDPSLGVLEGIRKVLRLWGGGEVAAVSHGTTVATNALLEERFDGLALVTT